MINFNCKIRKTHRYGIIYTKKITILSEYVFKD